MRRKQSFLLRTFLFLQGSPYKTLLWACADRTCGYFPFTRKDRTSASCVILFFCGAETFCKNFAGLRSPYPRLLSFHEESNQRRAKEEVSSLETPLRGRPHLCFLRCHTFLCAVPRMDKVHSPNFCVAQILPRELCEAKLSPPVCSGSRRMSGIAPPTSGSRVPLSSAATAGV